MKSKFFRGTLAALVFAVLVTGVVGLRWDNARLRERIAATRRQGEPAGRLREDNRRAREILARVESGADDGVRAIHAEVLQARGEAEALARRAEEQHADLVHEAAVFAAALANNRDPTQGLTRLEHFQNVGQGAPGAAVQTLVWAALKGDDDLLAKLLALDPAARQRSDALIARLPEAGRARWTPEKLAALWVTGLVTEVSAAQVLGETMPDATHATVTVRLGRAKEEQKIPLTRTDTGWQIVVGEKQIKGLEKQLGGVALPAAKK